MLIALLCADPPLVSEMKIESRQVATYRALEVWQITHLPNLFASVVTQMIVELRISISPPGAVWLAASCSPSYVLKRKQCSIRTFRKKLERRLNVMQSSAATILIRLSNRLEMSLSCPIDAPAVALLLASLHDNVRSCHLLFPFRTHRG